MGFGHNSSRRRALRFLALTPVACLAFAGRSADSQEAAASVCASHEDESMRYTLNYVDISPFGADKDCRNCEFWIPVESGASCGGCTLFGGTVDPLGYCDSWALAPGATSANEGGAAGQTNPSAVATAEQGNS